MTLTYSPVYGNKIRKLWKILAKADQLTGNSYEFNSPTKCKVSQLTVNISHVHLKILFNFYVHVHCNRHVIVQIPYDFIVNVKICNCINTFYL